MSRDWPSLVSDSTFAPLAVLESPRVFGDAFPSADMLAAAAALFPSDGRRQTLRGAQVPDGAMFGWGAYETAYGPNQRVSAAEGSWPELVIAPGLVRIRRRDASAYDRAQRRIQHQREMRARHRDSLLKRRIYAPMALWMSDDEIEREISDGKTRTRGSIARWSARSQTRMIQRILSLDLHAIVAGVRTPVMVTLTLPDKWLEVAPDSDTMAAKFDAFRRAYDDRFGEARWIWKREFQLRGAPHYHLWLVPPTDDLLKFQRQLRAMWSRALKITDVDDFRKSVRYGVSVDRAEGMRARDPRRLAFYFLKESGNAGTKAYQNEPPAAWKENESVGRYWGVRRIATAEQVVTLAPEDFETLYDRLADMRAAVTGWNRDGDGQLVNVRTGVVIADPYACWIATPSGSDLAVVLAALLYEPDEPSPPALA